MLVKTLIAEAPIKRFDVGVLVGLARFDQSERDATRRRPRHHGPSAELQGVVGAQDARQATHRRQAVEYPRDGQPAKRASRHDGHGFGRRVINDRQTLHDPPVSRAVEDKVGRPDLIWGLGPHQWLPVRHRDLLAPTPAHLEFGFGVQTFDALVVHPLALLPAVSDRSCRPRSAPLVSGAGV